MKRNNINTNFPTHQVTFDICSTKEEQLTSDNSFHCVFVPVRKI